MKEDTFRKPDSKEFILCAAVHYDDEAIYPYQPEGVVTGFVVCGHKHGNCISYLMDRLAILDESAIPSKMTEGFLTSNNRFVDRAEAAKIALAAGQIKRKKAAMLYSEDLY